MSTVSLQDVKRDFDAVLRNVRSSDEPTIIDAEEGEQFVLVSMAQFNSWQETLYLSSNPANLANLLKSIEEVKAGKVFERDLIES